MKIANENLTTRFLLGKLPEAESIKLEEDYFKNHQLFEEILFAETDLIDAYVTGRLSSEDQTLFESRLLLNPRQRQKVEFAKTLVHYASQIPFPEEELNAVPAKLSWISIISRFLTHKPALSFSFAMAALILFVGGIWLVSDKHNPQLNQTEELAVSQTPAPVQSQVPVIETNNNQPMVERKTGIAVRSLKPDQPKLPSTKPEALPQKKIPAIFSLILSPGLTRDQGTDQKFTVPAKTDFVRLQLKFEPGNFSSYHATLETVEGHQVWSSHKLKVQKGMTVLIPSKRLKKADYILTLKGINQEGIYENVESYTFTILKTKSND